MTGKRRISGLQMSRRGLLAGALAAGVGACTRPGHADMTAREPGPERPNILWLVSEDNNPWLGIYGDRLAHTPNLDALAAKGIVYRNAFSTAPVCAPSRYAILTGMHAESNAPAQHMRAEAHLPAAVPTYPSLLRAAGYYCTNNSKTDYNSDVDPAAIWDDSSAGAHWRGRPAGLPFMAVFNSLTTHERFLFKPTPGRIGPEDIRLPAYLPDLPEIRQDFASYHNVIEKMDAEIGVRLAELEADGLADDTVIIYYGDNGGVMPRSKHYPYNEGFAVPLIAYLPPRWAHLAPVAPGTTVSAPVSFADLAPTLLSLAGIEIPSIMQGGALLGAAAKPPRKFAFGARDRMDERDGFVRVVMDGRYHYMRNYLPHRPFGTEMSYPWQMKSYQAWERAWRAGALNHAQSSFFEPQPFEALYDLRADPDQLHNLAKDPAHQAALAACREALDDHMIAIRDNGFIPEGLPLEGWEKTRREATYPLRRIMPLAARAAGQDPEGAAVFLAALGDDNAVIRYWGAMGFLLAAKRTPAEDALLVKTLRGDASPYVRLVAAEALVSGAHRDEALAYLAGLTGDGSSQPLRLQALNALTEIPLKGEIFVREAAVAASGADELQLRNAARYLVQKIDGSYDPMRPVFDRDYFLENLPKE